MDKTLKLMRVYIPFVFTFATLIGLIVFMLTNIEPSFLFMASGVFGGSMLVDFYMFICSRRMCIYYKANIICLFVSHVINILYDYFCIDCTLYLSALIILMIVGVICFIIFERRYVVKV